jgi:flagellar biosynthesis component FlhA
VRSRLARHWVYEVVDALHRVGPPRWVRLEPDAEEALLERSVSGQDGTALAFDDATRQGWLDRIHAAAHTDDEAGPMVLLVNPRVRPAAVQLVGGVTPHVPVLSTAELAAAGLAPTGEPAWVA